MPYYVIFFCLLMPAALFSQVWQPGGFTPTEFVAADIDGNALTLVSRYNVYTSSDASAEWRQMLSPANAPFLDPDKALTTVLGTRRFNGFKRTLTQVHGRQLILTAVYNEDPDSRLIGGNYDVYTSTDGGASLALAFRDTGRLGAPSLGMPVGFYRVDSLTYLAQFKYEGLDTSRARTVVYRSADGLQSWRPILAVREETEFDYIGVRSIPTAVQAGFVAGTDLVLLELTSGNFVDTIPLPNRATDAAFDGEDILAFTYSNASSFDGNFIVSRLGTKTDWRDTTLRLERGAVFGVQLIADRLVIAQERFDSVGTTDYSYDVNNLLKPAITLPGRRAESDTDPLRISSDGRLISTSQQEASSSSANPRAVVEPAAFYIYDASITRRTALQQPPYALGALGKLGTGYLAFDRPGGGLSLTNDGRRFVRRVQALPARQVTHFAAGTQAAFPGGRRGLGASIFATPAGQLSTFGYTADRPWEDSTQSVYRRSDDLDAPNGVIATRDAGNTWTPVDSSYLFSGTPLGDAKSQVWLSTAGSARLSGRRYVSRDTGVTWSALLNGARVPVNSAETSYSPYPSTWMYNQHVFVYDGKQLYHSADGGETVDTVKAPFSFAKAYVYQLRDSIRVRTQDERLFSASLADWLKEPGSIDEGVQTDLELSVDMVPPRPSPGEDFSVTYTATNTSEVATDFVSLRTEISPNGGDVRERNERPTGILTRGPISSGETQSLTYYYTLQRPVLVTPWGEVSSYLPDVDSRAGNAEPFAVPREDDEALFVGPDCTSDTLAPVFVNCSDSTVVSFVGDPFGQLFEPLVARDDCSLLPTLQGNYQPSDKLAAGEYTVLYVATDNGENTAVCNFQIEVRDTTSSPCASDVVAPVLVNCPADTVLLTTTGRAVLTYTLPTAADNCEAASLAISASIISGTSLGHGDTTVVFVAEDAQGNADSCTMRVSVLADTTSNALSPFAQADLALSLAPNPVTANQQAAITYTYQGSEQLVLRISDALGRQVLMLALPRGQASSATQRLPVLPAGMYSVQLTAGNSLTARRTLLAVED